MKQPSLFDYGEAQPLIDRGWTPMKPINGVTRWRSPDGRHIWPLWRALEWLRNGEGEREAAEKE